VLPPATARHPGVRVMRHDPRQRPFLVIWEATRACPLACRHCRATATPDRHPEELTTTEATGLLHQIVGFGAPPPLLVITGGDPFARPDLTDLVRAGTSRGLHVAIAPSGTPGLSDRLAELHAAGAVAISLSLDGSTAARHDAFRGVAGVYRATLAAWRAARELGLRVQINTTVGRHNLDDLADIVALVHRHGAMTWSAFLLVPTGRAATLSKLRPDEVEDVLHFVDHAGNLIPTKTTEAPQFRRVALQRRALEARGLDPVAELRPGPLYHRLHHRLTDLLPAAPARPHRPPLTVGAGDGFAFVSHLGEVYPSGFLPLSAGNVRDRSLVDVYRTSELFVGLRDPDRLTGRCRQCEFRTVCGGSRARAHALTGNPYAEDPWCAYRPGRLPVVVDFDPWSPAAPPVTPSSSTRREERRATGSSRDDASVT
jgi:radical SAM protein